MNIFKRLFHKHQWDKVHGWFDDPLPGAKCKVKGCGKVHTGDNA